jgi:hypothetical protein
MIECRGFIGKCLVLYVSYESFHVESFLDNKKRHYEIYYLDFVKSATNNSLTSILQRASQS